MQDLCIFGLEGLFFLSTLLGVLRQGISSFISFTLSIVNPKVVLWQFLSSLDLLRAWSFHIYEALEVIVVCEHEDFMLVAFEVVLPSFEHFNDCQQSNVMGLIPSLSKNHLSKEKSYQMSLDRIIWSQLTENSTNSITRSIHLNLDMMLRIKMIYYQRLNKRLPQFGKDIYSFVGEEQSWVAAKVFSLGSFWFFRSDPLFELSRFLAFTTFLCWLFFISILHLNSLTTLLGIFVCWGCH